LRVAHSLGPTFPDKLKMREQLRLERRGGHRIRTDSSGFELVSRPSAEARTMLE
jgi:hypothetical protein